MKQLITICLITLAFNTANAMSLLDVKSTQVAADLETVAKATLDRTADKEESMRETCDNDYTNDMENKQAQQALIEACTRLGL